jgi:hypothetical protein
MGWPGHVACIRKKRNAYRVLMGTLEGKKPLGRPRRGWEDNIKADHRYIEWGGMDSIHLAGSC